jgi:hypothetical protein
MLLGLQYIHSCTQLHHSGKLPSVLQVAPHIAVEVAFHVQFAEPHLPLKTEMKEEIKDFKN